LLLNDAGDQLILKNIVGVNIPENQLIILKPDEGIAGEVLRNGKVVRVADVKNDERFKKVEDSNANLANSLLCAPLIDSKKIIGVINVVDSMRQEATFTVEDEHLLVSIASQLSMTMENLHLQTEMIEKERMSKELEIAGVIQENLFPLDHPKIVGYESDFNSNPAKEAGGDYYDYLPLDELRTGFVIADVSGKGVPAALVMVMVRSYLKVEGHKSILPQEVVARLNDHLTNMIAQDRFVTLLYGILNQADHTFHFTSAGHNYPIFYQHAEKLASEVELNGLILGVMDGVEFEEKTLEFAPLDILVLYTDGVTEAQNVDAVLYGEDRLCRLVEENADKTAHQLREIIENDVTEFAKGTPQGDDITLVVIKRDGDDLTKAEGKSTH
jgi:sigma-B regulation protein RsbU (phosphoserine phosphatase)